MYNAVMNPALPAVVNTNPNCWKMEAMKRTVPQTPPATRRDFLFFGVSSDRDEVVPSSSTDESSCFMLVLFIKKSMGISTAAPNQKRTAVKVRGPT